MTGLLTFEIVELWLDLKLCGLGLEILVFFIVHHWQSSEC